MKKLIIAEKPSVGKTIAKAVGATIARDGYYEGENYLVSWCVGHLISLAQSKSYDEKYKTWKLQNLPIIPQEWKYEVIDGTKNQYKLLEKLMNKKEVESLIEATDAGREGELIFRLVYNFSGCKKPFERLWISSLEEASIREGMKNLQPSERFDSLYEAATMRNKADWLYGINGTILYTILHPEIAKMVSVGRVQTPTLAMIVDRQNEIDNFQVTKRWAVINQFDGWQLETEKFEEEAKAQECLEKVKDKETLIKSVTTQTKKLNPPLLYSLTTLQQDANKRFGFTADYTLSLIQKLYEKKILTYPRTDSNYLTSDMEENFSYIVNKFGQEKGIKIKSVKRVINNEKVSDHYAIIPTMLYANKHEEATINSDEEKILDAIVLRILQATSDVCEYEECKVVGECSGYDFFGIGRKITKPGWKGIKSSNSQEEKKTVKNNFPTELVKDAVFFAYENRLENKDTTAPNPYTDDTLLGAMERAGRKDFDKEVERKGLGTSATRASTIEILISRGYVIRDGKYLIPTNSGKELIRVVEDKFKNVDTTVEWENQLLDIEKGASSEEFKEKIQKEVSDVVSKKALAESPILGKCPICQGEMLANGNIIECQNCHRRLYRTQRILAEGGLSNHEIIQLLNGQKIKRLCISKAQKTFEAELYINTQMSIERPEYIFVSMLIDKMGEQLCKCPVCGGEMTATAKMVTCQKCQRKIYKTPDYLTRELTNEQVVKLVNRETIKVGLKTKKMAKRTRTEIKLDWSKTLEGGFFRDRKSVV